VGTSIKVTDTRTGGDGRRPPSRRTAVVIGLVVLLIAGGTTLVNSNLVVLDDSEPLEISRRRARSQVRNLEVRSLDGRGNNRRHPNWGRPGTNYVRLAPASYADGLSAPVSGPNSRYVSNRVFNDLHRNIFSEVGVSQWVFAWGQFLDHTIGLRDEAGTSQDIPFDSTDPLEEFTNDLGVLSFTRSAEAPGTGVTSPRETVNTVSSYLEASAVYGDDPTRLEWLREGPVDGDLSNNSATLLLPDQLLPRRDSRDDAATAPDMATDGRLRGEPDRAVVAGDVRANENIALQATHTLFAREHNRIVSLLPDSLSEEEKFQIARRVVGAEQQYITYNEFLPAVGVDLPRYRGYNREVPADISQEFATVGYRVHSMIHGDLEMTAPADRYTADQLAGLEASGVEVEPSEDGAEVAFTVPLNVAFFNPDLLEQLQLDALVQGLGVNVQYNNDELIDNQLRSVLFQVPVPDNVACLDGEELPQCFQGVVDLGATHIDRGRDHGIPPYNELREAYGLDPVSSFEEITGESTEEFPTDPLLTPGSEIDDPDSLEFVQFLDADGNDVEVSGNRRVEGVRRTTLAARLKAIYGSVDQLDAFVGMVAEPHVPGTEFGELQLAIWTRQFQALRDGDRFFYRNDRGLRLIQQAFGIDYRQSMAQIIAANSDVPLEELSDNVFLVPEEVPAPEPAPAPETTTTTATGPGPGSTDTTSTTTPSTETTTTSGVTTSTTTSTTPATTTTTLAARAAVLPATRRVRRRRHPGARP
jgi:hypothetical protein